MKADTEDWEIFAETRDQLGESVLWHPRERALYWIDYYGPFVHRKRTRDATVETWKLDGGEIVGSVTFAGEGLLVAMDHGLHLFEPGTGKTRFFADPKRGRRDLVYNDAKVDRVGRYWVGTLCLNEDDATAGFYRMRPDGSAVLADEGFAICNGPAFSPDNRRLYFSDSMGRRIISYALDPNGTAFGRRTFFTFADEDGLPDGLAVDSAGNVWCALYGGAKVVCIDPSGSLRRSIAVPAKYATSLCFGGPGLRTLFVTTGWNTPEEAAVTRDAGGSVFARSVDVSGLEEPVARLRASS